MPDHGSRILILYLGVGILLLEGKLVGLCVTISAQTFKRPTETYTVQSHDFKG